MVERQGYRLMGIAKGFIILSKISSQGVAELCAPTGKYK